VPQEEEEVLVVVIMKITLLIDVLQSILAEFYERFGGN